MPTSILDDAYYFIIFIIILLIIVLIITIVNSIYFSKLMVDNNGTKIDKTSATILLSFNIIVAFVALIGMIWSCMSLVSFNKVGVADKNADGSSYNNYPASDQSIVGVNDLTTRTTTRTNVIGSDAQSIR